MNETENGEFDNVLSFPPRPIVPTPPESTVDGIPLVSTKDIVLSSALSSKLESLRAHIMICKSGTCHTCAEREKRFEMVVEQIKAEMTVVNDLRKKINEQADVDMALKAYIDMQEHPGRAIEIIQQYKESHIKRIK